MKRIHSFLVCEVTDSNFSVLGRANYNAESTRQLTSWHQTWDYARDLVSKATSCGDRPKAKIAICDVESKLRVIGVFCQVNLEEAETGIVNGRWSSTVIGATGYFANLNRTHYGWGWVPGAERESPFRLNGLERHMERKPRGLVARSISLLAEARDLLMPT